ncbi:MAG: DUF4148 domain-containing protein [Candidatus Eremiobacteraeota bacterium]|nr:DUF4148 domain-containing protein [Candidatus Eremiobacteraeota bacterium]
MRNKLYVLLVAASLLAGVSAAAPVPAPITAPNSPASPTTRDGRDDFAFEFGTWRTHYRILSDRLVGSHHWNDCYGTSVVRAFWNGSANLEDGDLKCSTRYIGGLTLRLYDAKTHQWTLWWGTRKLGVAPPPQIGHFEGGVGRFYAYDSWKGTPVICRFQWTLRNGNPHFEQAYSTDGGRNWETNWTTDYARAPASAKGVWNAADATPDGHDGFNFLLGTWKTEYLRKRHPLASDREWYPCHGSSTVRAFWGGSGNLEEGEIHCPTQDIRGITLRLYDATKRQWALYWGTQSKGLALGLPQVGTFDRSGVGEFFAPDTFDGKPIIVRYRWEMRSGGPHYEQAFSLDRGRTWQTNWTTDYTRS